MKNKNVTVVIVTFKSEKVIFKCLRSIKNIRKIVIFDNSFDKKLKQKILLKFPRVNFILSANNLGYGAANNVVLKKIKTKYAMILNPDTVLLKGCIEKLSNLAKKLNNEFSIIAPSTKNSEKNFGFFSKNKKIKKYKNKNFFEVDFVKGFAMFVNLKKIKKVGYFDENFFMYLEEIDLCRRLKKINENIFVSTDAQCEHLGAKSSNIGFDFEINRNWHWMWSKIYYSSKHSGFLIARLIAISEFIRLFVKVLFYTFFFNNRKLSIAKARLVGLSASFFKLKSYFRLKLNAK